MQCTAYLNEDECERHFAPRRGTLNVPLQWLDAIHNELAAYGINQTADQPRFLCNDTTNFLQESWLFYKALASQIDY